MALFHSDPADAHHPAEQHTTVGAATTLDGSIRAQGNLTVTGDVPVCERLVLRPAAAVDGDIRAGALVIEEAAVFNGRREMGAAVRPADVPRLALPDGFVLTRVAPAAA